jgi:tyrosinase
MPTIPVSPRVLLPPVRWRRNVTQLSAGQLADFRNAMTQAQAITDDRGYQRNAGIHGLPLPISCQHGTNLFFPWHRAYLYFFERALRDFVPRLALPFWDWTKTQSIPPAYSPA